MQMKTENVLLNSHVSRANVVNMNEQIYSFALIARIALRTEPQPSGVVPA